MSIVRAPRPESSFYTLDKRISEDARLSWAARGLLIFLLGKPDHWTISIEHLRKQTEGARIKTGRDGIYAMLDELQATGYITRRPQKRGDDGRLSEADYLVSETPLQSEPNTDGPRPAEPYAAEPTLVSNEVQQELIVAKEHSSPPATRSKFDAFWAAYPRKENKKKAEEVWKRKKLDSIADQIIADVQDRAARHKQWIDGFIPHPTTYLNGERWTDEIREEPLGGRGLAVSGVQQMPQSKTGQALLDIQRFRDELREEMGHEG